MFNNLFYHQDSYITMEYQRKNEYDLTLETFHSLREKIKTIEGKIKSKTCFLGFDGYIDSLYSLVKSRSGPKQWNPMKKMETFGEIIKKVAGSAANIERVLKRRTSGGFAPNTAKAMNTLGININLVAALGYPKIMDLFTPLIDRESVKAISFSDPGETLGLEFSNGKLLMPDFSNVINIRWDLLMERIELDYLVSLMKDSNLMGFGHWTSLPYFNQIWTHILEEVIPKIQNIREKLFFVDLGDIRKRKRKDKTEMLQILQKIDEEVPVVLSLNDQEAIEISKILETVHIIDPTKSNFSDYFEGGKRINQELNLSYLVIHSPHFATLSLADGKHYWVTQGYTSEPHFTTGGGEYFHSGTLMGLSCDLKPEEAILMGNSLTGIFVRTGKAPNFNQLTNYIDNYLAFIEQDLPEFPL